jgi:LuxR family maltose regulon positive regulatory protein
MNLLQTKLRMPPLRREHLPRPRLHRLLQGGLDGRLTLVSAPAGFGKTTLLCEWLRGHDLPVAWLSLDEHDNAGPSSSLRGEACKLEPGGHGLLRSKSPQLHPLDAMLRPSAEIGRSPAVLIVLDDYIILDQRSGCSLMVDNQPAGMHLVLCGGPPPWPLAPPGRCADRILPRPAPSLGGLAAAERPPGAGVTQDLSTLEERTEGWIAGLHLAAMSLKSAPDRHAFVEAFAGSDRFVLDYLMEEVLSAQPAEVRSFLLETSVLERFNAGLCDAVTGRLDSENMLRRQAGNLFVVPLDLSACKYAALMRSFLRSIQRRRIRSMWPRCTCGPANGSKPTAISSTPSSMRSGRETMSASASCCNPMGCPWSFKASCPLC